MKSHVKALLYICMVSTIFTSVSAHWSYVDFDTAMQLCNYQKSVVTTRSVVGIEGQELLTLFRNLYEKNNPSAVMPQQQLKIPRVFHFIWLGSALPEIAQRFIATWAEFNPTWEIRVWTDKEAAQLTLYNQKYYDQTDNYGVKSDLLKWELIYRFGGVYVDIDYECLQSFDELGLHYRYDFYTGIQPLDTQFVQLGAALFGAVPGHPILKHCIETIKDDWEKKGAPQRTGPVHFTKSFFAVAGRDGRCDIAFPPRYLYPLGCQQTEHLRAQWAEHGAFAVHHWAKSWMPKKYRSALFKTIDNDALVQEWNDVGKGL